MRGAALEPPTIEAIRTAQNQVAGSAIRTPLIRLNLEEAPAQVFLKLENLQPIGSFKLRGAGNAMAMADPQRMIRGVYTASAGNMGQGVAWNARQRVIPCAVVVPETAPEAKLAAITRLGAEIMKVPFDEWWQVMVDWCYEPLGDRLFIHPFAETAVMAGNGTIGLEIVEDLPEVDSVVVPYGGGGLSCGIASALRAVKPDTRVFASEIETGAPLAASFAAGGPVEVAHTHSFVDGIGSKSLLTEMWPLASRLLDGSLVVSVAETAAAIRLMVERNHVVAEGAGATPVAAALAGKAGSGKVVCVVSGGNLDPSKLMKILAGAVP